MKTRREFLKNAGLLGGAALAANVTTGLPRAIGASAHRPNILFISIDDLNNCPSPFDPLSGAITPNIQKLADEGVAFQNAFCAAPYCGASRSSTLTGIAPPRSGVIYNQNLMTPSVMTNVLPKIKQSSILSLPAYFQTQGYQTWGAGKIFHAGFLGPNVSDRSYDPGAWSDYFEADAADIARTYPGARNYRDNRTYQQLVAGEGAMGDLPSMVGADYNTVDQENLMPDKLVAAWAVNKLANVATDQQPFFMGLGFFRPHIGMYVPQRFYDLYPLQSIRAPNFRDQIADIEDLPNYALRNLVNMDWTAYGATLADGTPSSDQYLLQQMAAKDGRAGDAQVIQAYYASVTFADECLGQVMTALDRSGLRDSTTVVLWADHGWFLGEKLSWQKYKSWEKSTRVPLIISTPNGPTGTNRSVVSLLDLYPTLVELSNGQMPAAQSNQLDGLSVCPLLRNPTVLDKDRFCVCTQSPSGAPGEPGFHSVRTDRWRYIAYPPQANGELSEELYDLAADPTEKKNLLYWEPRKHEAVRETLADLLAGYLAQTES